MKFQVPQFLETESKVVGPLTLKQFIYVAVAVIIIFILNQVLTHFGTFVVVSVFLLAIALALGFYQVDGIPLPNYLARAFSFSFGAKKYVFRKEQTQNQEGDEFKNYTSVSLKK